MTDQEKDLAEIRGDSDFVPTPEKILMAILKSLHRLESSIEDIRIAIVRVQHEVSDSAARREP